MPLCSPNEFDLSLLVEAVRAGSKSEEREVAAIAIVSRFFLAGNSSEWPPHLPGLTGGEREFYDDVRVCAGVLPPPLQDAGFHLGDHD